jgi:hypothetical protein
MWRRRPGWCAPGCPREPAGDGGGRFVTKVWTVSSTTNAILELADHLAALGIEKVVLESTSEVSLGTDGTGKRLRRRVSAKTRPSCARSSTICARSWR